jgi:hypothetical protein
LVPFVNIGGRRFLPESSVPEAFNDVLDGSPIIDKSFKNARGWEMVSRN